VDMVQAEAFLAVAEELHFGRAAERLRVSQPRVSRLIAMLERQVGAKLFDRTSRRVALTPLGEQFRDELGAAYAQLQAALDHARRAAREAAGQLRIGFTNTTEGPALSRLVAVFEARHPGCQVTLQEVPVTEAYAALRADEIDVLIHWLVIDEPDLPPARPSTAKTGWSLSPSATRSPVKRRSPWRISPGSRSPGRPRPSRPCCGRRSCRRTRPPASQSRPPTTPAAAARSGSWWPAG